MRTLFGRVGRRLGCSYKSSTKERAVATDNYLQIRLFSANVARVAPFFSTE